MSSLASQINGLIERERLAGRKVRARSEVPNSYDELTAEWLSEVVLGPDRECGVRSFSLGPPDNGSSNRRQIRLEYAPGAPESAPRTLFCKAAETPASRTVLAEFASSETEVRFYTKVRDRLGIPAPKCYFAGYNPQSYSYFVALEDLSGKVRFPDQSDTLARAEAEAMARSLAWFHAQFHEDPALGTESLPFLAWPSWWERLNGATPAFATYCQQAYTQSAALMPAALVGRGDEVWQRTLDSVDLHHALPKTLLHCDVHLKNWFITGEGELGLHDWQLVTVGHWSRDFVYAIVASLTVAQRREWFDDLLNLYLTELKANCAETASFTEAHKLCRQQLMSVLSFWTITLNPAPEMPDMQPRATIEAFLTRIFHAIDELDSLGAFP